MNIKQLFKLALTVAGLTQSAWAKQNGMNAATLTQLLEGKIKTSANANAEKVRAFIAQQREKLIELLRARKDAAKARLQKSKLFRIALAAVGISQEKFAKQNDSYAEEVVGVLAGHCNNDKLADCVDEFIESECEKLEKQIECGEI